MLDIGGLELLIIAVVALLVIGPERMPDALRTLGLWLGRLRRSFTSVKAEIEKEIGMDEVRRQLHNEHVMEEMKRIEREVKNTVDDAKIDPNLSNTAPASSSDNSDAPDTSSDQPSVSSESASINSPETSTEAMAGADLVEEPEPATPRPRSEAEVEAAYERKQKNQQQAQNQADV